MEEKRAYTREQRSRRGLDDPDVRFDLIAYDAGALVARYYLAYGDAEPEGDTPPPVTWAGAEHVDRVVLVAPPNFGSIAAMLRLVEGEVVSQAHPRVPAAILGTMPGLYQMLPRARHGQVVDEQAEALDPFDAELWETMGWGLASDDADSVLVHLLPDVRSAGERREIALDHLRKCLERARCVTASLDVPAALPPHVALIGFSADAVPTASLLRVDTRSGALTVADKAPGDGLVLRSSVLADERLGTVWTQRLQSPIDWDQLFLFHTDRAGLTGGAAFVNNLLYLLLEAPPAGLR